MWYLVPLGRIAPQLFGGEADLLVSDVLGKFGGCRLSGLEVWEFSLVIGRYAQTTTNRSPPKPQTAR